MKKMMKVLGGLAAVLAISCALAGKAQATPTQTALTAIVTLSDGYDVNPSTVAFQACDASLGNYFQATGRDVLLVYNSDGSTTRSFTVSSVSLGHRTGDLTNAMPYGTYRVTQMFPLTGWQQSDGNIYLSCTNANIKFQVIRIP